MAVRDRNMFVWQAYVIASSIISVILLGVMFWLWRVASDKTRQLEAKNTELANAQDTFRTTKEHKDRLLSMLGVGQWAQADLERMRQNSSKDPEMESVEVEFAKMQTMFPANEALSNRNLMRLPQLLLETIRLKNTELADSRNRINDLQAQMTKEVEDNRRARELAEDAQKKAEKDLADARVAHKKEIENLNREKAVNLEQYDKYKRDFDKDLASLRSTNRELETQKTQADQTIARQFERIQQFDRPDYANAQGQITGVADGGTIAWINLGRASGLRKGVVFSILDAKEVNISNAVPKAQITIQEVDEFSAMGAVSFGSDVISRNRYYQNVAKEGDLVYSPAWRPGRKVSFALVGKMDINGDLNDDIEQVRQLIESAGGVVVAELAVKGALKGKIDPQTDFVVTGSDIQTAAESKIPAVAARAKEYAQFLADFEKIGVRGRMTVDSLLGYLKVDESTRIIPLGDRIQGKDFPIRNQVTPPASTGRVSEIFDRKPTKP